MATRTKTVRYCLGNLDTAPHSLDKCWSVTGGGVTWTNETTDVNSSTASDVPLGGAVGDALYLGSTRQFVSTTWDIATTPAGGAATWEYWNGSTWSALTVTGGTAPADNTVIRFDPPTDWATTAVNGEGDGPFYYIRLRVTTLRTTAGTVNAVAIAAQIVLANARTINIPETSGRTIRHAVLRVVAMSSVTETIDHLRIQGRWGAAAYADIATPWTTTNNWSGAGESWGMVFEFDWTSAFNTALGAGTSATCDAWLALHGRGTAAGGTAIGRKTSAWAELLVTYEYDDAATTQLNTVVLPIDSNTGDVTAVLASLGGSNAWPQLTGGGGIMPESSPVIRDAYLVFVANANEAGTTDWDFRAALDAESETVIGSFDAQSQGDFYMEVPWRRADAATGSAHDVKVRVSSTTGATLAHVGALLVVTYEYDHSASSRVLHTDVMAMRINDGYMPGTTASSQAKETTDFWVEGANPTLVRGGAVFYAHQNADPTNLNIAFGSQTPRVYTTPPADTSGPTTMVQRFDADGVAGSGITFARGKNTLTVTAFVGQAASVASGALNGLIFLTYSYDKGSSKQSCAYFPTTQTPTFNASVRHTGTLQFFIPETNYYISTARSLIWENTNNSQLGCLMKYQLDANNGWYEMPPGLNVIDAQQGVRMSTGRAGNGLIKYPGHAAIDASRVDPISVSRTFIAEGASGRMSGGIWVCWHDYTWAVSGTISGSDGGTVTLTLHDSETHEVLKSTSRVGDGSYSFTWHDNTRDVYVEAYESDTKLGRSADSLAGT